MNRLILSNKESSLMLEVSNGRWEYYVLLQEQQLRDFWVQHVSTEQRDVLFVIGRGFDLRVGIGLRAVLAAGGGGRRDVVGIDFQEGPLSASLNHQELVVRNWDEVTKSVGDRGDVSIRKIDFWSVEGRRISSQSARDLFGSADTFRSYSDIIIDISAMPRGVYFPLIARILYLIDHLASETKRLNLHVIVAEDPKYDATVHSEGIDETAEFLSSFGGGFDEEGTPTPKVWMPMMGEGKNVHFDRIQDRVKPDEVCPVLPSPSRHPRRADDIVVQYRQELFDELNLDTRDFLYVSEHNPFEVYRRLRGAVIRYTNVFKILGGCRVAISPMSSKLMSLGALLTAYELKELGYRVGIAHIEAHGYRVEDEIPDADLYGLWLCGECDGR